MGHVPAGPVRVVGEGRHFQGRQRGGAPGEGAVAIGPDPAPHAAAARRRAFGEAAEQRAAAWYSANGYDVLARNWRCREGELDLVARRGATVVFCEVKARADERFGTPAEAVTVSKQARLRRVAARWLSENRAALRLRGASVRFDVATVAGGRFRVIEEAF